MKQCIENPNDVDWASFWAERLAKKVNKNWDEAAPGFYKRTHKEDYNTALFDKLILDKNNQEYVSFDSDTSIALEEYRNGHESK